METGKDDGYKLPEEESEKPSSIRPVFNMLPKNAEIDNGYTGVYMLTPFHGLDQIPGLNLKGMDLPLLNDIETMAKTGGVESVLSDNIVTGAELMTAMGEYGKALEKQFAGRGLQLPQIQPQTLTAAASLLQDNGIPDPDGRMARGVALTAEIKAAQANGVDFTKPQDAAPQPGLQPTLEPKP